MIDRLLRALAEADSASAAGLAPEELADIVWLASCLDGSAAVRPQPLDRSDAPSPEPSDGTARQHRRGTAQGGPSEARTERHYATADLADHSAAPTGSGSRHGDLVRVARAGALTDPLAVMRALRPLGRHAGADSRGEPELDEEATVSTGADQRMLIPVLRPRPGRWLDLALVIDTHRSMVLWHDLVADLRRVVTQTGVFRDVRTWYLGGTEADGSPVLYTRPGGTPRRPQEIADPSGHRLVLVVTDTVGGAWGQPALDSVLRGWARHGSAAVLNVLPERLWSRGAVRPSPLSLRTTAPAAPNARWESTATGRRGRVHRRRGAEAVGRPLPVPIVEPNPAGLAALATLLSGSGRRARLSCLLVDGAGHTGSGPGPEAGTDLVLEGEHTLSETDRPAASATAAAVLRRFRETASPPARELAGYLSAVPLVLPVMTLVRRTMLPQSDHGHLAEVLLGGLLAPWEAPAPGLSTDDLKFEFLPGLRDALLGAQRREDILRIRVAVRHQVAAYLRSHRGTPADFPAARVADGTRGRALAPGALPFAESAVTGAAAPPRPSRTIPVADALADPALLGVEPPERRPGAEGLPALIPYHRRELDDELSRAVRHALDGRSTGVLVVGAPGTGRTRACLEALRQLPDGWQLWRPDGALDICTRTAEIGPRTVVWLDDAESVFGAQDPAGAAAIDLLTRLIRERPTLAPVLLLGTLRTDSLGYVGERVGENRLRALVESAETVTVPERFTSQEVTAVRRDSQTDPRLAEAVRVATSDRRVVQILAAAPWLRRRLDEAPTTVRALLNAVLDAMRIGHRRGLSGPALAAKAQAYLADEQFQQLPSDWFTDALAHAVRGSGSTGLLQPWHETASTETFYTLHPLVEEWCETLMPRLPGPLWSAATTASEPGWDEDDTRPYFFLSYAHTPESGDLGASDPNHWVRQLYRDLCEAVLQLTTVPDGVAVGFMDESMHQGELWAERLSDELATCRVFVPLYSPRYFNSVPCGQEWHAFTRRPVYPANLDSGRTGGIVPVLWAPMSRYRLPNVASELQFDHASFGPEYATEGLYALMKLSYFRSSYELAVHRLAARIVQVAEETVIPAGRRLEISGLPSAFNVTAPTKQLRIYVLADRRDELPADRSPDYYGERRTDWHPYRPVGSPIAQHATRLARQLGFQPTVHEFDDEVESIIDGNAEAPGLLLLDRWALRDPRRRELVRRFDRSDATWVSILEPFNGDDPECAERSDELGDLSDETLRITRRASRPSSLGATGQTGLHTLEDFDDALPRAAMKAKYAFEGRTRAEPEEPPPPSLRDAFRRPGG